jgi:uncharacterized protein (DUF952 family)
VILHLLTAAAAAATQAQGRREYVPPTFADDGFIHCTAGDDLMLQVANRFYAGVAEPMVAWTIDEALVRSDVRWEPPMPENPPNYEGPLFPHIYGPLNLDAVVGGRRLVRDEEGAFVGYEPM